MDEFEKLFTVQPGRPANRIQIPFYDPACSVLQAIEASSYLLQSFYSVVEDGACRQAQHMGHGLAFQPGGMIEVLHDAVRGMITPAVVRFVEHKEGNLVHAHESMGKGIAEDVVGANDDADVEEHFVPDALGAPKVAAIFAEQQLRGIGRKLLRYHAVLLLSEADFGAEEPDAL